MPTVSTNGKRAVAGAIQQSEPGVEVARDVEFGELWQFFKDTGYRPDGSEVVAMKRQLENPCS
jgi:hypothetical protein